MTDPPWPDDDLATAAYARLLDRIGTEPWPDERSLTDGEHRSLQAAAMGMEAKETAFVFGIGEETVKTQLMRARRKLRAKNTTGAVAAALRRGLIV